MSLDVGLPGDYQQLPSTGFIAADTIVGKIVVDKLPSGGGGNQGLPANANLLGGGRVLELIASSSDAANKDVLFYPGFEATLASAMGTIGITATTNSTITRTIGSFITDGWRSGDLAMGFGATNAGNNGTVPILTGVAAQTLTFNGTAALPTAEVPSAATFRLFRLGSPTRATIALGSGVNSGIPNVQLVGSPCDSSLDKTGIWLGANSVLIAAMQAAVSALPAWVSITPRVARY